MERKQHRGNKLGFSLKMEGQEETKKKIPRKTTTQSNSTSSFPLDLTSEILSRLPAKSIVRFRCVSKDWSAITTDPCFINSFKTHNATRVSVLIFLKKHNKLFVFSIQQDHQNSIEFYTTPIPIGLYQMRSEYSKLYPTESVHGLICFPDSGRPILWNPTMREFLTLSKPEESWKDITCFLGYDPIEGSHKVMCMPHGIFIDECRVLTLGEAQQTWRSIKFNQKHRINRGCYGRCINGVVYYLARPDHSDVQVVMSFDVRSEELGVIKLPSNIYNQMLIPYEGRVAFFANHFIDGAIKLWILEDAEKHEWLCQHFVAHLKHYDSIRQIFYHLDRISPAGEFVYVPWDANEKFNVLYFDPKRQSSRYMELVDEEFRLSSGLGNERVDWICSCPDHIESLMSFCNN